MPGEQRLSALAAFRAGARFVEVDAIGGAAVRAADMNRFHGHGIEGGPILIQDLRIDG
jgi:hypothetical protein